ncbi:MAG TPA: 30S ribosomal protein S4, partial [Methanomicrobiales archaeon]|nr:30S ribosomal protein S4 [Methanomicrobiales archaeon]
LVSTSTDEKRIETKRGELIGHLQRMGLLGPNADIDDVLALKAEQELERRLQTIIYRRGLARSPKQARQFITHGHIAVRGRKVTIPGYRVERIEEEQIGYYQQSPLKTDMHPERARISKVGR